MSMNVVCLGDSITYSVNHDNGWVSMLQQSFPDSTFINAGVPGDGLTGMYYRSLDYLAVPGARNIMIIWGGTNDMMGSRSTTELTNTLTQIVNSAKAQGFETWVVDTLPRWIFSPDMVMGFNKLEQTTVPYDRFIDMFPYFTTDGYNANTALYNESPDYVHPNTAGDRVVASVLTAALNAQTSSIFAGVTGGGQGLFAQDRAFLAASS